MRRIGFEHRWITAILVGLLILTVAACGGSEGAAPHCTRPHPFPRRRPRRFQRRPRPRHPRPQLPLRRLMVLMEWVVTEEELNQRLQETLADQQDLPISDVAIRWSPT